ncbi:MAG: chromosomal replication initiator protein DnaA [Planctomycetes bacterium]|nr:chromosomal replication initiator protein DnaA [Planctomycetota bacterium]
MEDSHIATALSSQLAERIGAQRFELWFGPQTRLCIEATCLTIHAASEFVRDWLRKNLADDIRAVWQAIVGQAATVEFAVDKSLPLEAERSEAAVAVVNEAVGAKTQAKPSAAVVEPVAARGELTLAEFVVGGSNEYAFRAAQLTASGRQQASPLLFYGPTGVGKTHLLRAVAREYRRLNPRSTAVYLTAEQFTTSFIEAIRGSGLPSFRQKCRGANLLLIDDLQFFVGKDRTLQELQYTIDTLIADGRQIVLASDRPLAELRFLGSELTSRLAGGLACEIQTPEFATRLEIARRICVHLGLVLEDDVLSTVAAQINAGARELRGALHRLQAMSLAYDVPVTREMAERTIAEMARHSARTVKLADVQKVVCDVFGIEPAQLRSERKGRALSEPRILAMWLARKYTSAAWSDIAQFFGRRSHSTVISAHRRVEKLISSQGQIGMNDRSCGVEEAIRRLETALRTA